MTADDIVLTESSQAPEQAETQSAPHINATPPDIAPDAAPVASAMDELPEDASFAELLAAHDTDTGTQSLRQGERVRVKVVHIGEDTVFVATGSKVDGVVERKELETPEGELPVSIGDYLELYVVAVNSNEIMLSKAMSGAGGVAALEEARDAGLPVEGKVVGPCKGGFTVEILKRRAFCPASQMDLRPGTDPESHVGKSYPFLITKLEKNARNLVVSRRILLEREQAEAMSEAMSSLNPGDTLEVTVTRLAPFGAFVEIAPGLEGMVHISELSWSRVQQPDEAVSVGDKLRAKLLSIQEGDKGKGPRIALSVKQAEGDPWESALERLAVGQIINGKVTRLAQFGAFVEILPGIEGLVHLSEMSWTRRVNKAEDVVAPGDTVSAKIKEISPERRRISLSMKEAEGDPWSDVEERFAPGSSVTGTVEQRAQFGLFINLAPGVTALLPSALASASSQAKVLAALTPGESVTLVVKSVDTAARRITVAPEDTAEGDGDWREYAKPAKSASGGSGAAGKAGKATAAAGPQLGLLGLALQAAAEKKKTK